MDLTVNIPQHLDNQGQLISTRSKAQRLHWGTDSFVSPFATPKSGLHNRRHICVPLLRFANTHPAHTRFALGTRIKYAPPILLPQPARASGPLPKPFPPKRGYSISAINRLSKRG